MTVKELRELLYNFNDETEVKCCFECSNIEEATDIDAVVRLTYYVGGKTKDTVVIRMS
jgi:hypothetical protein